MSAQGGASLFGRFPALAMTEAEVRAAARRNPLVAQINAVHFPRIRTMEIGGVRSDRLQRRLSPAVQFHPELLAGLDRVRELPMLFDVTGLGGVDRVYSNTGRPTLPFRGARSFDLEELRAEERTRTGLNVFQQRQLDIDYMQAFDLAEYGGQPTQAVVFHADEWTEPDGVLACPVFGAWSQRRIAQLVALSSRVCFWCGRRSETPLNDYLLVSCGATLRVFPADASCRDRFDRDTDFRGLDWHDRSDRWFFEVGCPSDEYI